MLIDLSPLKNNREFRYLYAGQFISALGSKLTYVALPYQVYQLTHSSLSVGMVSLFQLVPLMISSLVGGALADTVDRKKLLITSETCLALCCAILCWNSLRENPSLHLIYAIAAVSSVFVGFHRPVLEALTSKVLDRSEIVAASGLSSLKMNVSTVLGPGIAGILIAHTGLQETYAIDVITYGFSIFAVLKLRKPMNADGTRKFNLATLVEGFRYARSRQELLGTYFIDIIAMVFGMPQALFPAISEQFGGPVVLGWIYAAPSVGALIANIFSGWATKVHRHGKAIALAAIAWGIAIILFGLSTNLYLALFFLALAGAADMVSVQFRFAIWRQTIPDSIRGRMAGMEVLSYLSGPLLGDAEAGFVASIMGVAFSVVSGGALCVLGVGAALIFLPNFWRYDARDHM